MTNICSFFGPRRFSGEHETIAGMKRPESKGALLFGICGRYQSELALGGHRPVRFRRIAYLEQHN